MLWESLGRHFTHMTYLEADLLSKRNKEFIKSLFPQSDIYASLLQQRHVQCVLRDLVATVSREQIGSPAIIVVGDVLRAADCLGLHLPKALAA